MPEEHRRPLRYQTSSLASRAYRFFRTVRKIPARRPLESLNSFANYTEEAGRTPAISALPGRQSQESFDFASPSICRLFRDRFPCLRSIHRHLAEFPSNAKRLNQSEILNFGPPIQNGAEVISVDPPYRGAPAMEESRILYVARGFVEMST